MSTPNVNVPVPFTLIGSNFHDSFVDSLEANKQCTVTTVSAFIEDKIPVAEHGVRVIVLQGHDDKFANKNTLTTLLDQSAILAFFAPSKEVLDALQKTTKCLLHLPSVELEDGTPLIIHKRPHDGMISVTPGFSAQTESTTKAGEISSEAAVTPKVTPSISALPPAIPTPDQKLVMNFAKSVKMILITAYYHVDLLNRDGPVPVAEDHLTPPPGTKFYRTIEIIFDSWWLDSPGQPEFPFPVPVTHQEYRYFSVFQMHAYCANAKPTDPNFVENGGRVHIFAVLNGQVVRRDDYDPRQIDNSGRPFSYMHWFLDSVLYEYDPRYTGDGSQPQTGHTDGLITTYNIDFQKTINLWEDDNMLFKFTAKYNDNFVRNQFKQKVESEEPGKYSVLFYYDNHYDRSVGYGDWKNNVFDKGRVKTFPEDDIPLHALFAWSTSSLEMSLFRYHVRHTFAGFMDANADGKHITTTDNWVTRGFTLDLSPETWE